MEALSHTIISTSNFLIELIKEFNDRSSNAALLYVGINIESRCFFTVTF
jgi:nanoRNase/pAp phosphatase (c-di-AMP/oligoRNAs hydrolase)